MKKHENNLRKTVDQSDGVKTHQITIEEAAELTRTYRKQFPERQIAEFFPEDVFKAILKQKGCEGIRIYYGMDPKDGKLHLVLVGTEANNNDMVEGIIAERALCCPTYCGKPNQLNS